MEIPMFALYKVNVMKTSFNEYTDTDYEELLEMVFSLYQEDPEGEEMNELKVERTIQEYKKNPQKLKIVMFHLGQEIIGYAFLVYFWSNEYGGNILTVDELYVKPEHRGQGVGTHFLKYVEKEEGTAAFQIETTPSNKRVLKYYERMGYRRSENTHLMKSKTL